MSLTYFLNDLEMVTVAPIFTGITLVFTFHMRCISIVRSLFIIIIIINIIFRSLRAQICIMQHMCQSTRWDPIYIVRYNK